MRVEARATAACEDVANATEDDLRVCISAEVGCAVVKLTWATYRSEVSTVSLTGGLGGGDLGNTTGTSGALQVGGLLGSSDLFIGFPERVRISIPSRCHPGWRKKKKTPNSRGEG
jgi:hypothetical protein